MTTEFQSTKQEIIRELLATTPIHTGSWQRIDTSASPAHATHELLDVMLSIDVPMSLEEWQNELLPDLPWADRHFLERIGGIPLNPPPSHEIWPYAVRGNGQHIDGGKFSHTYPERFWPKHAGEVECHDPYSFGNMGGVIPVDKYGQADDGRQMCHGRRGIRFHYGDLSDVISLLVREPLTRQAFLPIWFPEDTGVHAGQRVPCTLGYHFLIRDNVLTCRYYMRSCDIYRHFTNDIYMAGRLMQYVADSLNTENYHVLRDTDGSPMDPPDFVPVTTGHLTMYITSLHAFVGDTLKLRELL